MKAAEAHKMSNEELQVEQERLRRAIYDLRSQVVTEKLENPRQVTNLRRDLARVLTERRQRELREKKA